MSLRRFIIDTDTGSDDVWALIEALRSPEVRVEAVTTVCGNLPLALCTKNAMLASEAAGREKPTVYRGAEHPLCGDGDFFAPHVHGADGLGGMNLPAPAQRPGEESAAEAMVRLARKNPGELELVTIGPLTNLALAVQMDESFARNVKKAWILGGSAGDFGNMTKWAEYNVYVDPEAADILLRSGMRMTWVTWDAVRLGGEITWAEAEQLSSSGDRAARFCVRCTEQLRRYYFGRYGRESFSVVDTAVMTAALFPDVMTECAPAHCTVSLAEGEARGHFTADFAAGTPNAEVCTAICVPEYKKRLFSLLTADS